MRQCPRTMTPLQRDFTMDTTPSTHLKRISEMLMRHKLVVGITQGQDSPRSEVVKTLLHRQQLADLHNVTSQLSVEELSQVLESLPLEDAVLLWAQIPESRENEILWEVSDTRREQLVGARDPVFAASQMNAFQLVDGRLRQLPIASRKDLDGIQPIWIDLLNSTKSERTYIGMHFGLTLPNASDATDLEVSTRFHTEESGDIHLHSNFLLDREGNSRSVPVSFIVHRGVLFTLRNEELPVFRLQRSRARTQPGYVSDCHDVLIDLYGADVEYSADSLEDIYGTLGKVGKQVLSEAMTDSEAASILGDVAAEEDLNGRIRSNIMDTQRAIHLIAMTPSNHSQRPQGTVRRATSSITAMPCSTPK